MSPELINAITERILNGHTKESIKNEVISMGHTEALFEAAYMLAENDVAESAVQAKSLQKSALSSVHMLVKKAIAFTCDRWGMVVLVASPLILLALLTELTVHFENNLALSGLFSGLSIVVMFFYFINMMVLLYLVSRGSELETITYREGFLWTKKNFFGIFFVYFLTIFAVWGGFVLFIIPGFFLLISLYFSQYVFVLEEKRGMAALLRSRAIVKGRWFTVLKKVIGMTLYFFIPVFLVMLVIEIINEYYSLAQFKLLGELLIEIASAFFVVVSMHVMFNLYRELAVGVEDTSVNKSVSARHWFVVAIGILALPVVLITLFIFNGMNEIKETVTLPTEDNLLLLQMSRIDVTADDYFSRQGTFEGICTEITDSLESTSSVSCNDTHEAWAVSVVDGEELWCMDSKLAVPKRIQSEIGERTACIVVE